MHKTTLKLFSFVLMVSSLLVCYYPWGNSSTVATTSDLSDPAAALDYGIEVVPYQENPGCGPQYHGLTVRPPNHDDLYLVWDIVVNDHQLTDYIVQYVLNPKLLPHYPERPNQAFITLVDWREGETAWRARAITAVRAAYYRIWNEAARERYGMGYELLQRHHKEYILLDFPLMIIAAGPWILPPPPPPPPPVGWER